MYELVFLLQYIQLFLKIKKKRILPFSEATDVDIGAGRRTQAGESNHQASDITSINPGGGGSFPFGSKDLSVSFVPLEFASLSLIGVKSSKWQVFQIYSNLILLPFYPYFIPLDETVFLSFLTIL